MRRSSLTLAIGTAAMVAAVPAHATPRPRCATTTGQTLVRTAASRVYRLDGQTLACVNHLGRVVALDHPRGHELQSQILQVFADVYAVATVRVTDTSSGQGPAGLAVLDLRTGSRRFAAFYEGEVTPGADAFTVAVVRPSGSAAWIQTSTAFGQPAAEVRSQLANAKSSVLIDGSDGIDPRSLTRAGAQVSWLVNGERHTKELTARTAGFGSGLLAGDGGGYPWGPGCCRPRRSSLGCGGRASSSIKSS